MRRKNQKQSILDVPLKKKREKKKKKKEMMGENEAKE